MNDKSDAPIDQSPRLSMAPMQLPGPSMNQTFAKFITP